MKSINFSYKFSTFLFFIIALLALVVGFAFWFGCEPDKACIVLGLSVISVMFCVLGCLALVSCGLFVQNISKRRDWLKEDKVFKILSGSLQLIYLLYLLCILLVF